MTKFAEDKLSSNFENWTLMHCPQVNVLATPSFKFPTLGDEFSLVTESA